MNAESTMVLNVTDCWSYLRQGEIGRLAVIIDDAPEIFPINYAVQHSAIVFRSAEGSKVDALLHNPQVALEVDGFEPESNTAWSVILKRPAKPINNTEELIDTLSLDIFPWQPGAKNRFIRIDAEAVTGRRFTVTDSSVWLTSLTRAAKSPNE